MRRWFPRLGHWSPCSDHVTRAAPRRERDKPRRCEQWCHDGEVNEARSSGPPAGEPPPYGERASQRGVVLCFERSEIESALRCYLFVLGAAALEVNVARRRDRQKPCEFELGVAGDKLGFPL